MLRSFVWHHEESRLLFVRRNGDLGRRSFADRRNGDEDPPHHHHHDLLMAGDLLKLLVVERLDFVELKRAECLAFQRDLCVLRTSARQVLYL